MNLRPKTGLIIGGTFLVLLSLQFVGSVVIISRNIRDVELSTSKLDVGRVRNAIEEKIRSLDTSASDYGTWDDSYDFMQTRSQEFLESNFEGTTSLHLNANLILILDRAGIPVFEKDLDLGRRCELPPFFPAGRPFSIPELLKEPPELEGELSPASTDSAAAPEDRQGRRGLIRLGDRLLLAACRPILPTSGVGPHRGFIIMGRDLDAAEMAEVAGTTDLSCSAFTAGDSTFAAERAWLLPLLSGGSAVATRVVGDDVLAAYTAMNDITGQPAVYLRVQMPRDLHRQGWMALRYFAVSLLITGVIVACITLMLMQRVIIARLLGLSRFVTEIGRDRSVSRRVASAGSDELSALSHGINEMLGSLEQADFELRVARVRAEDASRAKGDFLANMSHEIRTPMNGVLGMTRILLASGLNPPQREVALNIDHCAKNLLRILNDVLDYSKIEAGKLTVEAVPFDLADLMEELAQVHGVTAAEKSVALTCRYEPSTPRECIGDPGRIRQVLGNLLGNAVKFTEWGEVGLEATCVERDEATARIRVCVRDTGVGIPAEKIERIFEKFEQADTSTTRRFGGTGLGLAICRQLVQLMGGTIHVESEPSRGSTFSVELPLALPLPRDLTREEDRPNDLSPVRVLAAPSEEGQAAEVGQCLPVEFGGIAEELSPFLGERGAPPRILLAEDNLMNQKVAVYNLECLGCSVDVAGNGWEAMEMASLREYDLVLMDYFMPGMDGLEATASIRRREGAGRRTPILAMTAGVTEEDRARCMEAGMDGYLAKPILPADLHRALARYLGQPVAGLGNLYPDNPELVEQLIRMFLKDAPPYLGSLEEALAAGDTEQVVFHSHTLKGMAGNLNLRAVVDALQAMMGHGNARDIEQARADFPGLRDLFLSTSLGLKRSLPPEDEATPQSRAA